MGSPAILDIPALLQPIPGAAATGADPRKDVSPGSSFGRLKSARSQASSEERKGATDPESMQKSVGLWRSIGEQAIALLASGAKDLQVCAWLIESLVRAEGFRGLRDGFRLTRELCEQFWDGLHPMPDEDGVATRVAPLAGLNGDESEGTLIAPIARVPITSGSNGEAFATWHWTKASTSYQGNTSDESYESKREAFEAAATELRARLDAAVRASGAEFYGGLRGDLQEAIDEFDKLVAVLDQKCGQDAPPSSSIRGALTSSLEAMLAAAKDVLPADSSAAGVASANGGAPSGAPGGGASGPVNSREAAFAQLRQVADYFRRAEPHSPISYLVEQAVRYGSLSLPELLSELIPDEGARSGYFARTGIRPPAATS
jgi:type VI secretion system protein ImpA